MHWAGLIGVFGDVLIAAASMAFGQRDRGAAAIGWYAVAASAILFAVVDVLVGFVLAQSAAEAAFPALKRLFDALFLLGTATFGIGAVLAVASRARRGRRAFDAIAALLGAIALCGGAAGLFGLAVPPPILGAGIGGGALALIGMRHAMASSAPEVR